MLAWRAERARLHRRRRTAWSMENRLLQLVGWQALLYAAVYAFVGSAGVAFFALQGLIGASMLEVMNYIMHYGLRRGRLASGRLEAVRPQCSWNTRRLATTYLLSGIGLALASSLPALEAVPEVDNTRGRSGAARRPVRHVRAGVVPTSVAFGHGPARRLLDAPGDLARTA